MNRPLGVIATREVIDLQVSEVCPPIPTRNFDYSAIDANTYDADCDQDGYFSNSPQGAGATELEAINDLLDQLEAACLMIPKGIRFREGAVTGTDTAARFAYAQTSDGKTSYWGYDPTVTTAEEAAALLVEECKKLGITILMDNHFIPGNKDQGRDCPVCGLQLHHSISGYDDKGRLCHAGCL